MSAEGIRPRARNLADLSHPNPSVKWLSSHLGKLLWAIRVRASMPDSTRRGRGLLFEEGVVALYAQVGKAAAGANPRARVHVSAEDAAVLNATGRRYGGDSWTAWAVAATPDSCLLVATDATPSTLGYVVFSRQGRVMAAGSTQRDDTQVANEAHALAWGVEAVRRKFEYRGLIIAAVDADTVRVATNKGYARSRTLRSAVRDALRSGPLHVVRVAGTDNAADAPSRGREPTPAEETATFRILDGHRRLLGIPQADDGARPRSETPCSAESEPFAEDLSPTRSERAMQNATSTKRAHRT